MDKNVPCDWLQTRVDAIHVVHENFEGYQCERWVATMLM